MSRIWKTDWKRQKVKLTCIAVYNRWTPLFVRFNWTTVECFESLLPEQLSKLKLEETIKIYETLRDSPCKVLSTLCMTRSYLIRRYPVPLKKLMTLILCRIENLQGKTLIFNIKKTCHKISPDKSYHKVCHYYAQICLLCSYPPSGLFSFFFRGIFEYL